MTKRLNTYLYESGFFESREKARRAVMAGLVQVGGRIQNEPGIMLKGSEKIAVSNASEEFVSRGGIKLNGVLNRLGVDPDGLDCLDIGASTGGFTDCLLKRGAKRVIALDVGKGQLHWKLRNDHRVTVMEGVNARYLRLDDLAFRPELVVIDVSFISLDKIIEAAFGTLAEGGEVIALFKPQFDAEKKLVGKGGIIREPGIQVELVDEFRRKMEKIGIGIKSIASSPLKGAKGNREFFLRLGYGSGIGKGAIRKEVYYFHEGK
ncbi:MAG: TlyA family RNA methyltransferase [Actinomycetota bacterium]|nr:TlyA family RNA methyltransferase [Actinomycetota bacterium]